MVRARSIASRTRAWLWDPKPARILHAFDNACNLLSEDGEVVSLVTPWVGDGPFNIVLDPINFRDHAEDDPAVRIEHERIRIGELEIALTSAQVWEPRFEWESFRGRQESLSISTGILEEVLVDTAPVEGFVQLIRPRASSVREIEMQVLLFAQEPAQILLEGLLRGDEELCRSSAKKLAGLGAGLTPDGDDFMMGCILALWARWAGKRVEETATWVSLEAAPRTTPIAAAWLKAASRGECSVRWHDMLQAILKEDEKSMRSAAHAIIDQGHTSGASALTGFTTVLKGMLVETALN